MHSVHELKARAAGQHRPGAPLPLTVSPTPGSPRSEHGTQHGQPAGACSAHHSSSHPAACAQVYDRLQELAIYVPVANNKAGSYLTSAWPLPAYSPCACFPGLRAAVHGHCQLSGQPVTPACLPACLQSALLLDHASERLGAR